MAIYRGVGGSGDANNDAIISDVAEYSLAAQTAATNAANSASSASSSATSASGSASAASTSATNAASSASSASTSQTDAANSATSAASSATSANSSKNAAATSATNAANSASDAATSASSASTSASAADTSATNAASSASAASTSATNAFNSASSASTSAINASNSASAASNSASNASLSATNASTSETNAATSETNAATSEANALASETAAAASEAATAALYDNFDDRYLGAKTADPTLDNDGNALVTGALYFNSLTGVMMVYNGTGWQSLASGSASVTSFNGRTGTVTLTSTDVTDALTYTPLAPSAIGTTVQAYDADTTKNDVSNTFTTNQVISTSSSSNALRITQTGTGNALVVEDSANPDSTPFVINAGGTVIAGNASAIGVAGGSPQIQNHSTGASGSLVSTTRWAAGSGAGGFSMAHSRGATIGAYDSLISGDAFGSLSFQGADGTGFIEGASINAYVDGTPSANNMPGRLVFSTTADGVPGTTERMRIRSDGNIGIGNSGADYQKLGVNGNYPFDSGGTTEVVSVRGTFVSGTTGASAFKSRPITATATFNIPSLAHFDAHPNTFGAGSTVTTQYGFIAQNTLTGATNNYGFFAGNISVSTGKSSYGFYSGVNSGTGTNYNFYAAGTADNYFAGNVGIGIVPISSSYALSTKTGSYVSFGLPTDAWARAGICADGVTYTSGILYSNGSFRATWACNGYRNTSNQWTSLGINSATGAAMIEQDPSGFITFHTDASKATGSSSSVTERMRIASDGALTLNGSGSPTAPLIRIANDTNTGIYSPGLDQIGFTTAGTAAMTLDASGNTNVYGTLGVKDSAPVTTAAINSSITYTANAGTRFGISNTLATTNEVLTADRITYGAYNSNSSTYQNSAAFTLTQYGSYNQASTNTTSGNTQDGEGSLVGSYNYALHQSDDATYKRIENGYGSYNYVFSSGDTSLIDVACGTFNYIRTAGTSASASVAITNGYGNYTSILAGTANRNITNAYGYYLHGPTQIGTITNAYGLYIAPAWSNHLAGGLTVGGTADSTLTQGIRAVGTIQGDSLYANLDLTVVGTSQFQDAITCLSSCGAYTFGVGANGAAATPSIYRTSDTNTGIFFPALDTVGVTCGGVEQFRVDGTGQLWNTVQSQVGTDYTTLYRGYLCRAWVNFNGTGTVAIRASGNVSSITDNGVGDYTVNFTAAMPDANYAANVSTSEISASRANSVQLVTLASTTLRFTTKFGDAAVGDASVVAVSVFR